MEIREYTWKMVAVLAVLILFSACQNSSLCTDQIGCVYLAPGEPLTIGIERATVGNDGFASRPVFEALNLAKNQQPTFHGHPIQFYIQDTTCTPPDQNATTGLLLSQPKLVAVIGPVCQAGADAYAKAISDAGIPLLSPAVALDSTVLPGVYTLFPSPQVLAANLDALLSSSFTVKTIDIFFWNAPLDIQFSNDFCNLWEKRGLECNKILQIDPDMTDITHIPHQIIGDPVILVFILPFSYLNQVPDFRDILNNRTAVFFDPELGVWDENQDPYSSGRTVITLRRQPDIEKMGFNLYGEYPEFSGLFAYDAYNILFRSLTEAAQITQDGKMTVPRQTLRSSFEKITDFTGLAGNYSCNSEHACLIKDNFLDVRLPIH